MPRVPCMRPAAGVVMIFSRAGRDRAHVRTATDGGYRVLLAPGTYRISVARPFAGRVKPVEATVHASQVRRLNVYLDSGIR